MLMSFSLVLLLSLLDAFADAGRSWAARSLLLSLSDGEADQVSLCSKCLSVPSVSLFQVSFFSKCLSVPSVSLFQVSLCSKCLSVLGSVCLLLPHPLGFIISYSI